MIKTRNDIKILLKKATIPPTLGLVSAADMHALEAISMAYDEKLIRPVLYGDTEQIKDCWKQLNVNTEVPEIVHCNSTEECVFNAIRDVHNGRLKCIMKGALETAVLMKAVVNSETGIKKSDCLSLISFNESPYYHKMFVITDVGLMTYPSLEQKKSILLNAVDMLHSLGIEKPKVAVMSSVENVNPKMPDSVHGGALKEMNLNGEIQGCVVEGPISYDLCMDPDAARIKGYVSEVAGDPDILLVPDIVSGNLLAKGLTVTGGAHTCGTIMGAKVPIALTSRSAPAEDKYYSIVLTAVVGNFENK